MARGWESKSVESQMEAAGERKARRRELSADEIVLEKKKDSLLLQRTRVLREMQSTRASSQLNAALKFLEDELKKVGWQES